MQLNSQKGWWAQVIGKYWRRIEVSIYTPRIISRGIESYLIMM